MADQLMNVVHSVVLINGDNMIFILMKSVRNVLKHQNARKNMKIMNDYIFFLLANLYYESHIISLLFIQIMAKKGRKMLLK